MKQNIITIIVGIAILLLIYKVMKMLQDQSVIMKSQTDIIVAVALKMAIQLPNKQQEPPSIKEKSKTVPVIVGPAVPKKNGVLPTLHKRVMKLFADQIPKTAGQLRTAYNKSATPMDAKKFNNMVWNMRNNRGLINFEKLEDSDSVWGLTEWFEIGDGGNATLTDEYFNRIIK